MVKIDLITGFLGSGKTTFLKKYAQYLINQGNRICILENDYGAVNVDMLLLNELRGEQCELEMVAGGCDYDCHKRRFKTKLISMGMCGYDRVLVEPSGIFDVDEFFDVLYEEPLERWYEIGNVIAVVDSGLENKLSKQSEYLLASQVAEAGVIVLSKTQNASDKQIQSVITHMNLSLDQVQCKRQVDSEVNTKDWNSYTEADWKNISECGYVHESYVKLPLEQDNKYASLYYMNIQIPEKELRDKIQRMMQDEKCGHIFRMKGFMKLNDEEWLEMNATHDQIAIHKTDKGQEVFIVIGEELVEQEIDKYWKK